ncbi:ABC transporter substrate-binding protein [Streptomyces sp. NPDC029526]|uniref:ABC transporter substrate-binding protein n=1 Tax=Streptomyces sp. NPDC029526 TaxID=3155728 RepID=UPI00340BE465
MASTRFRALATTAVAALALCTACSSDSSGSADASSADKPLKLAVFASLNGVPAFAADEEGVFDKHGLDVEIGTAKTSTEMVPQLLGGKVNLALLDTATSLVAAGQGVDLVYVAAATDGGIPEGQEDFSFANVWVKKNSPIKSLADLSGKTVGVPQIKSAPWVDLRGSVDEAGGDSSTIKFVESPDPLAALKSGQVDATTTPEPVGTVERAKGELHPLGPVNSGGGGSAYVWVTTRAFADANKDTVKAFAEAVREGNKAVNDDRDLLVKTAAEVLGADAGLLKKAAFPVYAEKPLTKADIEFSVEYMNKYDMFEKAAPDAEKLILP